MTDSPQSSKSSQAVSIKPRICCRLCLAPENECVNIYKTSAADKQPLQMKINACVQIKVHENDRLSPKICHACISYLNSWQSFKNRCDAAQRKQKSWIGLVPTEETSAGSGTSLLKQTQNSHNNNSSSNNSNNLRPALENAQQKFQQKQQELQKERLMQLLKQQQLQDLKMKHLMQQQLAKSKQNVDFDTSFIKSEPMDDEESTGPTMDDEDAENVQMDLDPSQFLATRVGSDSEDENDENHDENGTDNEMPDGPQILTSLGLTHINHINSGNGFNYMQNDSDFQDNDDSSFLHKSNISLNGTSGGGGSSKPQVPAKCSICNMQFSNRANARRHEKNIHGVQTIPMATNNNQFSGASTSTPSSSNNTSTINNAINGTPTTTTNSQSTPATTPRPRVKSRIKAEPAEEIDYNNPAKYRHLLSPAKLTFILRNLNFLEQAQDMTCKCCNKVFPSYKFFMGHMRKKYHSLPRNVCFKCLKQFQSKGQFIGHLKRRNCTNLYRLVMNDDTISKDIPCSNNRIPNKDILANKLYGCKLCQETFRLKVEFRDHVYKVHHDVQRNRETPNASCINCNEAFFDSNVRRRHFNNLDCMVFIICVTCQNQFVTNAQYIEHVYQTHLNQQNEVFKLDDDDTTELEPTSPPTGFRSPQVCPVCNKQYNNYYNVLRHMESKHPNQLPQIYQCPECQEGFPRQTELREHLSRVHNQMIPRSFKPLKLPAYICKVCFGQYETKKDWIDHQETEHQNYTCMFCEHKEETRDDFEQHLENVHQNYKGDGSYLDSSNENQDFDDRDDGEIDGELSENGEEEVSSVIKYETPEITEPTYELPQVPYQVKRITCRLCNKRISTKTGLKKHMVLEHGVTGNLVGCTLCKAEFANDKGLKVHLFRSHDIREADYASVLPPELLDPVLQQQRKLQQNLEEMKMLEDNENGKADYECDICNLVCKNRDELKEHKLGVHAIEDDGEDSEPGEDANEVSIPHIVGDMNNEEEAPVSRVNSPVNTEELWYQCRYCNRSFNSSKKLTIHMHSHEAVDHNDHTCKDCGSTYSSKKSLWVHRHKKHPRIPDPSPCEICKKTLFDKTELTYHMQTHSADPYFNDHVFASDNKQNAGGLFDHHLSFLLDNSIENKKMDESYKQQQIKRQQQIMSQQNSKKRSLAANPIIKPDGSQEFACDMCPKTFPVANALQVHRGWHFRSPDGRKVTDPGQMWHPDQVPPSKVRRTASSTVRSGTTTPAASATPPPPPVCEYCNSKFASYNNLRRHIIEVHKRHESRDSDDKVPLDRVGECSVCNKTFGTLAEWVDHKISDTRNKRFSTNYEWNCEICTKVFTRKERLLQHMLSHLNDREMDQEVLAKHQAKVASGEISVKIEETENSQSSQPDLQNVKYEANGRDHDDSDDSESEEQAEVNPGFNCGLCQVFFKTSQELRAHVAEHFLNGGSTKPNPPVQEVDEDTNDNDVDDAEDVDDGEGNVDDVIEEDDEEIAELEEDYAELDGSDVEMDNEVNDENTDAVEDSEEEVEEDEDDDSDELSSTSHSLTSSSVLSNGKIEQLQQDFAAISQEHKCQVCQQVWPDQLRAIACMNSHLDSN